MVLRAGKSTGCLDNNSGGASSPVPDGVGVGVKPVTISSRCVFLTCDGLDCMALLERCAWSISQGLCIRPGAHKIRYREPEVRL